MDSFEAIADGGDTAKLAEKIGALRKANGLTIRELAIRSGLSIGLLSQIERGKSPPSLRSLRMIGTALHIPVSALFDGDHGIFAENNVVRKFERPTLKLNGDVLKELMSPPSLQSLEIFNVVLQPNGSSSPEAYSHSGEKAVIVLSGTLTLWLADRRIDLSEGDSCQFASTTPHRYQNDGPTACQMFWVLTPPAS